MNGTAGYRRRIELVTVSPEVVQGELEDDFHHFRVSIAHDGANVTALEGTAVRHPWSTCPAALAPLRSLVGAPVTADATAHSTHGDARHDGPRPGRRGRHDEVGHGMENTCHTFATAVMATAVRMKASSRR